MTKLTRGIKLRRRVYKLRSGHGYNRVFRSSDGEDNPMTGLLKECEDESYGASAAD